VAQLRVRAEARKPAVVALRHDADAIGHRPPSRRHSIQFAARTESPSSYTRFVTPEMIIAHSPGLENLSSTRRNVGSLARPASRKRMQPGRRSPEMDRTARLHEKPRQSLGRSFHERPLQRLLHCIGDDVSRGTDRIGLCKATIRCRKDELSALAFVVAPIGDAQTLIALLPRGFNGNRTAERRVGAREDTRPRAMGAPR